MSRCLVLLVMLAWVASVGTAPAAEVPASVTIVGSAEVKLTGDGGRSSGRIVFAASAEPKALRLEIVRAGSVGAVVYCDPEVLRVLVPGAHSLLHEEKPTREAIETALGLPFCLDELLFALRVGHAPAPSCDGRTAVVVKDRSGRVAGLERAGQRGGHRDLLRFNRWSAGPNGQWPGRAVLETDGSVATLIFGTLRTHSTAPLDLDPQLLERARRVDASELRRALGLSETSR